jgi:hypothetical protein
MPKRARQAHVPKQVTRKRKAVRRDGGVTTGADPYLDVSGPIQVASGMARDPVGPIPMPARPAPARPQAPVTAPVRPGTLRAAGQLPTFERGYLVEELRRIAMTAGSLLALIVVLAVVLR